MRRAPSLTLPALLAALALAGGAGAASAANPIGVAAAVNPDALSHLGGVTTQVVIGKNILYNERIATSKKGLVQVLFIDGSTITVGPGSDLVIDKFVYDPATGAGELTASFSKGVLRFVGGRLSKNEGAVKFATPIGSLGIRGGMFQGRVGDGQGSFSFLFGEEMTFQGSNGETNRIFEANNTLQVGGPSGVPTIRPTRPEDAQFFLANLSGQGGPGGGVDGPTDDQVQNSGIGGANSGDGGLGGAPQLFNNLNTIRTDENDQSTTDIIRDFVQNQNNPPVQTLELPATVDMRVLMPGTVYKAFRSWKNRPIGVKRKLWIFDPENSGILGGTRFEDIDDFDVEGVQLVDGRYEGTAPAVDEWQWTNGHLTLGESDPTEFSFPTFNTPGVHAVADGITISHGEDGSDHVSHWAGSYFVNKEGSFIAYQLFEMQNNILDLNKPLLIFGGTPYDAPEASGKLRAFQLYTDPRQFIGGDPERPLLIPFAFADRAPASMQGATISPLLLLEQDLGGLGQSYGGESNEPYPSKSVWLQTSFQLTGEGENQESIIVVAAGLAVDKQDGEGDINNPRLLGERRGTSRVLLEDVTTEENPEGIKTGIGLSGGIATLTGPGDDGKDLFGVDAPSFVIGADSTGHQGNIFYDRPLGDVSEVYGKSDLAGATYHIGEQEHEIPADIVEANQTLDKISGYAAGMMESNGEPPQMVASATLDDFFIDFDTTANTLSARANVIDVDGQGGGTSYDLYFGARTFHNYALSTSQLVEKVSDNNGSQDGISAYIDDNRFAAFETPWQTTVNDEGQIDDYPKVKTYIVGGGLLNEQQIFGSSDINTDGDGVHAFCTQCDFIKWGAWGGQIEFKTWDEGGNPNKTTDFFHMGWWVAGDIASNQQIDTLTGGATYTGQAIGNVAAMQNGQWQNYTAHGRLDMNWDFGTRRGDLTISNFDRQNGGSGYTFGTEPNGLSAPPDLNKFSGNLNGSGLSGSATGSFVNSPEVVAKGVAGNWNVGGEGYKAVGVFAGAK